MNTDTDELVSADQLDISNMQLGVDGLVFSLQHREQVRTMAHSLATQAKRELLLHTVNLEADIYDHQPLLDAVSTFVRQHPDACFNILIQDSRQTQQHGHRLIELSRRLSSRIQFRRPPPQYLRYNKTFLLCDDAGYYYRPQANRYEGSASFNNPGQVFSLKKYFLEVWEQSAVDEEFRRLDV